MKRGWLFVGALLSVAALADTTVPASLGWSQRVELTPSVSGVIETVVAQPGQRVAAGALLLRLNPTIFLAKKAEAQAERDRLAAEARDAATDLSRAKELYARTVSSTTELEAVQLRHARVAAQLAAAEARLSVANRRLSETELRAPFPARILERRAEPGMAVAARCQPPVLLVLAHADERTVSAVIPPAQAARIQPGGRLSVELDGKSIPAAVRSVTALADGRYRLETVIATARLPGETEVELRLQ